MGSIREIDNDLPEYLVFLILKGIRDLKKLEPDHILVKAIESAAPEYLEAAASNPKQVELDLVQPQRHDPACQGVDEGKAHKHDHDEGCPWYGFGVTWNDPNDEMDDTPCLC